MVEPVQQSGEQLPAAGLVLVGGVIVLVLTAAAAGGGLAQASMGAGYHILPPDRPVAGRTYADYSAVF